LIEVFFREVKEECAAEQHKDQEVRWLDDVFRSDKQNGHLGAGVRGIEKKEEKIKREAEK